MMIGRPLEKPHFLESGTYWAFEAPFSCLNTVNMGIMQRNSRERVGNGGAVGSEARKLCRLIPCRFLGKVR